MPYDFLKANRASGSIEDSYEFQIQRELNAWRLQMREERQRRLVAAAARAARAQSTATESASHEAVSQLGQGGGRRGEEGRQNEGSRGHLGHHHDLTELQEYRMELNETRRETQRRRSAPWCSEAKIPHQRQTKQTGVTYHKARSVLREYIHRPPLLLPTQGLPRAPNGALQAYKDALAVSVRMYRQSPVAASSWHQRPLRNISGGGGRHDQALAVSSAVPTRATILRKRHTVRSSATREAERSSASGVRNSVRSKGRPVSPGSQSQRLMEPAVVRQCTMRPHREGGDFFALDEDVRPQEGSPSLCRHREKSTTQPMASPSPSPDDSPQPRPPLETAPRTCWGEQRVPTTSSPTPTKTVLLEDVAVSPPTPTRNGIGTPPHCEVHFRREPSPLLTDLLSRLTQPTQMLYRPDLYQGHRRSNAEPASRVEHQTTGTSPDRAEHRAKAFYLSPFRSRGE